MARNLTVTRIYEKLPQLEWKNANRQTSFQAKKKKKIYGLRFKSI